MISGLKTKRDREIERESLGIRDLEGEKREIKIGVQEFRERERGIGAWGFKEREILKVRDLEREIGLGV